MGREVRLIGIWMLNLLMQVSNLSSELVELGDERFFRMRVLLVMG